MLLLTLAFVSANLQVAAQEGKALNNEFVMLSFGRSKHGSGDIRGFSFATEYTRYFKKKLSWSVSIGTTVHDGEDILFYEMAGQMQNGSIRYTTAGVQGLFGMGYSIIQRSRSEVKVNLNTLLRYQTSSYSGRGIYFPGATGLPFPVVQFHHWSPARTFTLGASLSGGYHYTFDKGVMLGVSGAFQTDLNGDVLSHTSFSIGKRF